MANLDRFPSLRPSELQVLGTLFKRASEGLVKRELDAVSDLHPGSVGALLRRLEARGLVERPSCVDRRSHLWQLTELGFRLVETMAGFVEEHAEDLQ